MINGPRTSMALVLLAAHLRGGHAWGNSHYDSGNYGTHQRVQRVPMNSIDTLTFYNGKHTNARRVGAVPQLACVGGDARHEANHNVNVVQCRKMGSGYGNNIQWKCEAELPVSLKLGETTVSCEGYEHSNDPFVLQGSCGLEYTLHKTGASDNTYHNGYNSDYSRHYRNSHSGGSAWFSYLMLGLLGYAFLGSSMFFWGAMAYGASAVLGISMSSIVCIALLMWFLSPRRSDGSFNRAYHSTGWGSGWGSPFSQSYGHNGHPGHNPYGGSSWPNFFGGMAAGGLASSMFSPSRNYHYGNHHHSSSYRPSFSSSGASGRRTHTSSGFGGTQNR